MYKNEYLNTQSVREFINWIEKRMDFPNSFVHMYKMKKPAMEWECNSLYSAFKNYSWRFGHKHPTSNNKILGSTFLDSYKSLNMLADGLNKSIDNSDYETCQKYCYSVLEWGGVLSKNDKRIMLLGNDICSYLKEVRNRFNSDIPYNQYYTKKIIMNSGFTKIYSLCIDDFIIYDGRVGAALGLLVRMFCEENKLNKVPDELAFAWGKGKESKYNNGVTNRRNPSKNNYEFPRLMNNPKRHTENNIKANWLLREILNNSTSKFSKLDKDIQMRALEAALFMIGYSVNEKL